MSNAKDNDANGSENSGGPSRFSRGIREMTTILPSVGLPIGITALDAAQDLQRAGGA